MGCDPKCAYTAALDGDGRRLMVSKCIGGKFPQETVHPMCPECLAAEIAEIQEQIDALSLGADLSKQYQAAKKKLNGGL